MNKDSQEFKKMIYELMNGFITDEAAAMSDVLGVHNEFKKGKMFECSERLYGAKDRVYDKLGVDDDPDIEIMLDCFETITEELCYKMYDYGMKFAKEQYTEE
ncbi:MAG: hypothetical protein Q4F24_03755 [Eubacteriales bacterium]|nr:hypothetical protein [Eubacteriales bacterium]